MYPPECEPFHDKAFIFIKNNLHSYCRPFCFWHVIRVIDLSENNNKKYAYRVFMVWADK